MITVGSFVTLKKAKAHPMIPFKPGEVLRVLRVGKFKSEKKRIAVETVDQRYGTELFTSHLRQLDMFEYNGELKPFAFWAERIGITVSAFKDRIRYGWSMDEIIRTAKGQSPKAAP
jgi:hypothetical protein